MLGLVDSFSDRLCFFRYNSSLTNSTQLGNDSNYSKFNGENIATNCFMVTVLALDGLTKKHFGQYVLLKIFSFRSPSTKWICRTFLLESGLSNFLVLSICLLLVCFVSTAECHCFDL